MVFLLAPLSIILYHLYLHVEIYSFLPTGVEQSTCDPHDRIAGSSSTKLEQLADIAVADQVSKAKSSGILEHSPHDEIEGELLHLQSRLLDDVGGAKQRYGKGTFFPFRFYQIFSIAVLFIPMALLLQNELSSWFSLASESML